MSTNLTPEEQAVLALKEDLVRRSRSPEYSTRVIDLFERLAGEDFQKAGRKAIELVADGRSIERAMADALDWVKKENVIALSQRKAASN